MTLSSDTKIAVFNYNGTTPSYLGNITYYTITTTKTYTISKICINNTKLYFSSNNNNIYYNSAAHNTNVNTKVEILGTIVSDALVNSCICCNNTNVYYISNSSSSIIKSYNISNSSSSIFYTDSNNSTINGMILDLTNTYMYITTSGNYISQINLNTNTYIREWYKCNATPTYIFVNSKYLYYTDGTNTYKLSINNPFSISTENIVSISQPTTYYLVCASNNSNTVTQCDFEAIRIA